VAHWFSVDFIMLMFKHVGDWVTDSFSVVQFIFLLDEQLVVVFFPMAVEEFPEHLTFIAVLVAKLTFLVEDCGV
jgi:hypothetical protein